MPTGQALFRDDFTDRASGWREIETDSGRTAYTQGSFRIEVYQPKILVWATPGLWLADVRIEVDTLPRDGQEEDFGIICRVNADQSRFYFFLVSSDGYYGIGKFTEGQTVLLGHAQMVPVDLIQPGAVVNRLRAECIQDRLALFVNDLAVGEAQDAELAEGDVGLIAGTFGQVRAEVNFGAFRVYQP